MLKNKLLKFLIKKIVIFYIILSIIDLIVVHKKWYALLGLTIGTFLSLLRFGFSALTFSKLLPSVEGDLTVRQSITKYILSQLATVTVLAASILINVWIFAGLAAGILILPIVIMVNGLTEFLGITHNNFE